jgi:hypothetical protein
MNFQNCKHPFESNDLFCNQCGAQLQPARLTIGNIFRDFSERYFSFDNKFIKTCIALFKQPEEVVNGYINGLRIRYVNPITFGIIAVTLSGIQIYLINNGFIEFDIEIKAEQEVKIPFVIKDLIQWIFDHQSLIMFSSMPILALMSKLVFFKRKEFNFAEHNLIYLYTYSFCTILSLVFVLPFVVALNGKMSHYAYFSYIILFAYHTFALKRIFSLTNRQILLKTLLFLLVLAGVYLLLIIIGTVGFLIYMISTGQMSPPK